MAVITAPVTARKMNTTRQSPKNSSPAPMPGAMTGPSSLIEAIVPNTRAARRRL